jgi:hypothetical protein
MQARGPSLLCGALMLVVVTATAEVRADDTHDCVVASNEGQVLRDAHRLVEARGQFAQCARSVCPGAIRKACVDWRSGVEIELPTIVFAARDASGHDLLEVRVIVDRKPLLAKLDGSPIPVDPGPHVIRFEPAEGDAVEQDVIVRGGEKNRLVSVVVGASASTPGQASAPAGSTSDADHGEERSHPPWPVAALVLGAVGVVALGSFAYFGASGQADKNGLERTCVPSKTCDPSAVTSTRTKLIVADASLGVGVLSLGVSAYLLLTRPSRATSPRHGTLDLVPMRGGACTVWRGTF